ncbi:MAG: T9SS type A sorting domain-containing protein [Gracilimonas sp.]|uniref:T9SS type A sorting domain-containing protein n=1 Tax=Gracilimonas TaxID=649462 RepID=UPI001B0B36E0|nr:T9SS type A sorting domain-containing protein [Gracilimonas sp.]MBO6584552.1 T9SS type A sorting domain-containing protein [Gracilimonas sp.]MBO6616177.1 T9SS type A sorting domain-containing protein [Gracilimonas sp.]
MKRFILSVFLCLGISGMNVMAQVDYEDDIQPIFNASCTSCHGGQSGVTLTSYSATMNSEGSQYDKKIVIPGEPDNSPLVDKIEPNPQFGARMPQGGSLSDQQISLIRQWIAEGANEVATSNEVIAELPDGFELKGNYPNPFNPTTNITFSVPEAVSYQLKIYTAHGALVEEIAGNASAGETSVPVSFSNQPSGIYFYQLVAITANERYLLGSEKMTLVK